MATTTNLESLVINYLTQEQYDEAREAGTLEMNQLYLTPDTGSTGGTVTSVATGGGLTGGPITSSGTISHADTSSQSSVSNSGRTYIQSITLDTYGHVTNLSSATESVTNSDEKLGTDAVTSGTTYYIVAGTNTTGAERKKYDASGIAYKATNGTANGTNGEALLTLGNSTASTSANWKAGKIFLYSSSAYGGTLVPEAVTSSSKTWTLPNKTGTIALTSDIPDTSSFITVDEKLKWTASTTSSTYYPLQSTSTATTSTANTLNGISFYQYYNTAGGYRRLDLGNTTAWKSTGGAYGTIRLYGAAATYYGDLIPGVLGTTSGDGHLTANRTWTFPNASGTVALTSDIPTVPTKTSDLTNDGDGTSNFATMADIGSFGGGTVTSIATTSPISGGTITTTGTISHATSGVGTATTTAGFYKFKYDTYGHVTGVSSVTASDITNLVTIPTNTDENVKSTAVTAATTNYIVGSTTSTTTTGGLSKHASAVLYTTADSGTSGYTQLRLGNTTATSSAGGKEGQIRLYGTNATYYLDLKPGAIASSNKTITFPNASGTVALTSDIPDVSGFITSDSDYRVESIPLTTATTYYLLGSGNSGDVTSSVNKHASISAYVTADSSTSGYAYISIGNNTASGTAGAKYGYLRLYGSTAYYHELKAVQSYPSANRSVYFPRYTGDMYLTCVPGVVAVGGATTAPVYVDNTGTIQAVTSIPYSLLTGTPTIPTNTDEKVKLTASSSAVSYPMIFASSSNITSNNTYGAYYNTEFTVDPANFKLTLGTAQLNGSYATVANAGGINSLTLGNATAHSTASAHAEGRLILYGTGTFKSTIKCSSLSADQTISLPDKTGTIALTSDISATTITLNGTTTTSPSFYAPTSAGTSGYVLKSNGSGEPTWTSATLTDTKVTQAYSTTSSSYPLLMTATSGISSTSSRGATTSILNNQIYANPSTGTITATAFNGAAAATTAYTTANLKNIIESDAAPGSTTAPNGTVWLQYGNTWIDEAVDYVVEQGVSGIWTYRKWNSGIAECWGRTAAASFTMTSTSGYAYYTSQSYSLPSGLFTAVTSGFAERAQGTGSTPSNTLVTINMNNLTTTTIGTFIQSASSGTQSISISFFVIGSWK